MSNPWKESPLIALSLLVASLSPQAAAAERDSPTSNERLLAGQADRADPYMLTQLFTTTPEARQNPAEALKALRQNAEHGDPNAQYMVGLAYDVGVGAPQDFAEAAAWYQRAADKGHAGAQFNLGLLYAQGRGLPQDYVQAHMWFNLAAAGGEPAGRTERDEIAAKMTRSQVAEAIRLAREWQPK